MRAARPATWAAVAGSLVVVWAADVPWPVRGRLDATSPFTQLLALRPVLVAVALVVALVALVVAGRQRAGGWTAPFVVLLIGSAAAAFQIAPRAIGGADAAAADAPRLTVLVANTLTSDVAPKDIDAAVAASGADVVALPETNLVTARRYARTVGRTTGERWRAFADGRFLPDDPGPRPTAALVRAALGPQPLRTGARGVHGAVALEIRLPDGGASARIAAVHPAPPPPASTTVDAWRDDLLALRRPCRDGWIVAGDLNATIDHSPLRAVLRAGCTDAASATGNGLRATWRGGPLGLVRPAIDHVLGAGAWRPVASGVLALPGSDHKAVWARLTTG